MREKTWLKRGFWLICFLFLWLAFSLAAANFLDPDFGWHFKTGEWIWHHRQVPRTDSFSYTMSEYTWKCHAWLMDLIIYGLYPLIGYSGLAVFFGLIAALAFGLPLLKKPIGFAFAPWLLVGLAALSHLSVRPKVINYLLMAIVFWIIQKSYREPKWLLALPILFLAWANLHLGFPLGLVILLLAATSDFYLIFRQKKPLNKHLGLVLTSIVLSVIFSLINPYHWLVYQVIVDEIVLGQGAHFKIAEWLPFSTLNFGAIFYLGSSLAFLYLFRDRLSLFEKMTSLFLLIIGFWSGRFLIYYLLFSLPLFVSLVEIFYSQVKSRKRFLKIWRWRWRGLTIFLVFLGLVYFWLINLCQLGQGKFYPNKAVAFLQKREIAGNLFSIYNWGGYLIWQLPEKKVFIDGRMNVWKKDGYSAFEQMEEILANEVDYRPIFEKYSIAAALLPVPEDRERKRILTAWLRELFGEKEILSLNQRLAQDSWQLIYQDDTAQVLIRPE